MANSVSVAIDGRPVGSAARIIDESDWTNGDHRVVLWEPDAPLQAELSARAEESGLIDLAVGLPDGRTLAVSGGWVQEVMEDAPVRCYVACDRLSIDGIEGPDPAVERRP